MSKHELIIAIQELTNMAEKKGYLNHKVNQDNSQKNIKEYEKASLEFQRAFSGLMDCINNG